MLAIISASTIAIFIACNDSTSTSPETKDTTAILNVDSSKDEKKSKMG